MKNVVTFNGVNYRLVSLDNKEVVFCKGNIAKNFTAKAGTEAYRKLYEAFTANEAETLFEANEATKAEKVNEATKAEKVNEATKAENANEATKATKAEKVNEATKATKATKAEKATKATKATKAEKVNEATKAKKFSFFYTKEEENDKYAKLYLTLTARKIRVSEVCGRLLIEKDVGLRNFLLVLLALSAFGGFANSEDEYSSCERAIQSFEDFDVKAFVTFLKSNRTFGAGFQSFVRDVDFKTFEIIIDIDNVFTRVSNEDRVLARNTLTSLLGF